jgi:hypothetical protein
MEEKSRNLKIKEVPFHGDKVTVVEKNGDFYVAMKPLCEKIGLNWGSQQKHLQRDPVLKSTIVIMTIVAEDGRRRQMLVLPLSKLNGWLFRLDLHRYTGEMRNKLMVYQKECYDVLHERFFGAKGQMHKEFLTAIAAARKEADAAIKAAKDAAEAKKQEIDPKVQNALDAVEARVMFLLELLERGSGPLNLGFAGTEGLKLNLASIMDEIFVTKMPRRAA